MGRKVLVAQFVTESNAKSPTKLIGKIMTCGLARTPFLR